MKVEYKGFILVANREKVKDMYRTFYSAQHKETKMILAEDSENISIPDAIEDLKAEVDGYLKDTKNEA